MRYSSYFTSEPVPQLVPGWAKGDTGEYGPHAWNVVYPEDGYYHIDVTTDDPVPERGNKISYEYFLKTGEEAAKITNGNHMKSMVYLRKALQAIMFEGRKRV